MKTVLPRNLLGVFGLACLSFAVLYSTAWTQAIRDREQSSRILSVENVSVTNGSVSGEVVNRSRNTVRDVQLLIRYIWLWDNETKPGLDDPSRSFYYNLPGEISQGGRASFTFKPSQPLAKVSGGTSKLQRLSLGFRKYFCQVDKVLVSCSSDGRPANAVVTASRSR